MGAASCGSFLFTLYINVTTLIILRLITAL